MTTTLNPHHDELVVALHQHHRPTADLVEALDEVTHGLPSNEWPPCAYRLLWALHLPATNPEGIEQ